MLDFLATFALFYGALLTLPLLGLSYLVLSITHKLWYFFIQNLHPDVEFLKTTTVRTLLDTHRNQGIIAVLLSIKGQAQPAAVRRHIQEVVKRRDKSGNLSFPRLRHCLVARCGTYAWAKGRFDLDQNITVAPLSYKGRAVTEYNIQEYVCEIVSKYLPHGIPPWQIILIPSSEDQHYLLLKLHHVLLDEGLNIGDLLPLIPPTRQNPNFMPKSPLVEVLDRPQAIPKLKKCLSEELANFWNEFIANYDPLECTDLLKNSPNFFQFHAIVFITIIATIKEAKKGFRVIQNDLFSKFKFTALTLKREAKKREVNMESYVKSIFVSLDPRNLFKIFFCFARIAVVFPFKVPLAVFGEILALKSCILENICHHPKTLVGTLYNYVPLLYSSSFEILTYIKLLFKTPKIIVEDILLQKESFQTITLCGRKSVAWSDPVKLDTVKAISRNTGVSEVEVMLAAISAGISKYLTQTKHVIPDFLPVTLRNVNSNYIFATGANIKSEDSVSGILSLNLPILDPEKEVSVLETLADIQKNFKSSVERQGFWHLLTVVQTKSGFLTKILPLSLLGVYLRFLSRKYAVQVTEMSSRHPNVTQRSTWGQEVNSVIYWRPPQANSSVSLCLNEYGDHIKLGVMCDSQLAPHHQILVRGFPECVQELAREDTVQIYH